MNDNILTELENILKIEQSYEKESIRNSQVIIAVHKVFMRESRVLKSLYSEHKKLELIRWKHYSGKLSEEHYKKEPLKYAILKTDIDRYLKADAHIIASEKALHEQENVVKFCEDCIKRANGRGFDIKTAVEYTIFLAKG